MHESTTDGAAKDQNRTVAKHPVDWRGVPVRPGSPVIYVGHSGVMTEGSVRDEQAYTDDGRVRVRVASRNAGGKIRRDVLVKPRNLLVVEGLPDPPPMITAKRSALQSAQDELLELFTPGQLARMGLLSDAPEPDCASN